MRKEVILLLMGIIFMTGLVSSQSVEGYDAELIFSDNFSDGNYDGWFTIENTGVTYDASGGFLRIDASAGPNPKGVCTNFDYGDYQGIYVEWRDRSSTNTFNRGITLGGNNGSSLATHRIQRSDASNVARIQNITTAITGSANTANTAFINVNTSVIYNDWNVTLYSPQFLSGLLPAFTHNNTLCLFLGDSPAQADFDDIEVYGLTNQNGVVLLSPETEIITSDTNLSFNASLSPATSGSFENVNATLQIWYENGTLFDEETNLVTGTGINYTEWEISNLTAGEYLWNVLGCFSNSTATECNYAIQNRSFSIGVTVTNNTYNPITFETATESFITDITIPSGSSISSVNLIWNGTGYGGSINSLGGNEYRLSKTITIPTITGNISWYWAIVLDGSISLTTDTFQQTVTGLEIDDCSVNTHLLLNYTIYDEDTREFLNSSIYNTTASIFVRLSGDLSGEEFVYFAGEETDNPFQICAAEEILNQTYRLDSEVQYTADDYVTEYHFIEDLHITNASVPLNISLYLLSTLRSQEFLITFKDQNFIPVEGAIIELTRQYLDLGQFLQVEVMKTDYDGRTIGHFVLNDEVYTLYVRKDGDLLATFSNVKAFCANIATGDCRINLNPTGTGSQIQEFENAENVSFSQNYNDTTREYEVTFITTDSSVKTVNLTITKFDTFLNETACSSSLSGSSGTLSCIIPTTYTNDTVQAKIYVDGVEVSSNIFPVTLSNFEILDASRYLLGFILIIMLPLIGLSSGPMTIVLFILGLIGAGALALVDLGSYVGAFSALIWFIIAALVLLWKATRPKEDN